MKTIGVTGSRHGVKTNEQRIAVAEELIFRVKAGAKVRIHHGACNGFDEFVAVLARGLDCYVVAHPPINESHLSTLALGCSHEIREAKGYHERDRDVVDVSSELWVGPWHGEPQPRGGTWYTYRYAESQGKSTMIFWPNGRIAEVA